MTNTPLTQPKDMSPEVAFRELRCWVDEKLMSKGLLSRQATATRQMEGAPVTLEHIEQLKADIATLIKVESRRSLWSGIAANAFFFVLGIAAGAVAHRQ